MATMVTSTTSALKENNVALVQLLGLCPLLAVSNTLVNAIGLGLASLLVITLTNGLVSLCRPILLHEIRIPIFVLIIASTVTCIALLLEAFLFGLHQSLGIFLPLIVTNCMILARAEACASKVKLWQAIQDGFTTGLGFALALVLLGGIREILAYASLFRNAHQLLPFLSQDTAAAIEIRFLPDDWYRFLLFSLPPGAFIILGLLIAAHKWWLCHQSTHNSNQPKTSQANT